MGNGLITKLKVFRVLGLLEKRGTLSMDETRAMGYYLTVGRRPKFMKRIYDVTGTKGNEKFEKRGLARILYQPGFVNEIERKLNDYIIPFAKKTRLFCYIPAAKNKMISVQEARDRRAIDNSS